MIRGPKAGSRFVTLFRVQDLRLGLGGRRVREDDINPFVETGWIVE